MKPVKFVGIGHTSARAHAGVGSEHAQAVVICLLIRNVLVQRCCLLCRRAAGCPARWWPGSPGSSAQSLSRQLVAGSGPASVPAGNVCVISVSPRPGQVTPIYHHHLCYLARVCWNAGTRDILMCSRCHYSQLDHSPVPSNLSKHHAPATCSA